VPGVTREQLGRIATAFTRLGITRREDRLRLLGDAVGRHLYSSSQLTEDEADGIERRLRRATREGVRSTLNDIIRREEKAVAVRARAKEPPATLPGVNPSPDLVTRPAGKAGSVEQRPPGKVVGFMCPRSGRGKGCTPITEADMEEARNALAQMQIETQQTSEEST
jgi:hypothetical protein